MKKTARKNKTLIDYLVKLRIDKKTVIFVRSLESLANWKRNYPNAVEVL